MSKILDLYSELLSQKHRFIDEIFEAEIYGEACPKLTIVDLGAYEGEFSFYCYNFAKVIYAVEPDPQPYAILADHIKRFELDKIKAFNLAIAGESGKRFLQASHAGGSTLKNSLENPDIDIPVEALSLPDFFEQNGIKKVDILKIDVESAEYDIFESEGFSKVAKNIKTIVGEDHRGGLSDILKSHGFKFKFLPNCFIAKR